MAASKRAAILRFAIASGLTPFGRKGGCAARISRQSVLCDVMNEIKRAPAPLRIEDDLIIPLSERKTVETLLSNDCRWPFGDPLAPDFHFCGKHKNEGSPYCEFHMRRAFQSARSRPVVYRPYAA